MSSEYPGGDSGGADLSVVWWDVQPQGPRPPEPSPARPGPPAAPPPYPPPTVGAPTVRGATPPAYAPRRGASPPFGPLVGAAGLRGGEWSVGSLIADRYRVYKTLLSGMGVVYLCYDQEAREPIAIKTYRDVPHAPSPAATGSDDDRSLAHLFESEAMVWVRLGRHPHIVHAKYVLRLGRKPYVFLEFVPGPTGEESTLRRLLRGGRAAPATAIELAIQICAGMEYATRVFPGLVHRDLKPENLLLAADGVLKITDFGLTRVFADFSDRVGAFAGTLPYMSPEQMLGLPRLDARSDIFALGVILYELLTGTLPAFRGSTTEELFRSRLTDEPPPPREIESAVSEDLSRVVMRCLRKPAEERFASFGELKSALEACADAAGVGPPRLPPVEGAIDAAGSVQAGVELARALSLVALGRHEEALALFELAVEHDPGYARAWICKGVALAGLTRLDQAVDCFDRALAIDPRDVDTWLEKGRALA